MICSFYLELILTVDGSRHDNDKNRVRVVQVCSLRTVLNSFTYFKTSGCRDLRIDEMWKDLEALTTARAREFWIGWRRFNWHFGGLWYTDLQYSQSLDWTIEVRTVQAVLKIRYLKTDGYIYRSSRIWEWQSRVWSQRVSCSSNIKSRLYEQSERWDAKHPDSVENVGLYVWLPSADA